MEWFAKVWWALVARGFVSLAVAAVALAWPGGATSALALMFGIFALADGASSIAIIAVPHSRRDGAYLVRGLAGVLAGVTAVMTPSIAPVALSILAGMWALAAGGAELAFSVRARDAVHGALPLMGGSILTLVFAVPMIVFPPVGGFGVLVSIVALAMINGAAGIVAGVRMHGADVTPRLA
jgi:uncharacterized membrane protein HdeD (DUF308 family)